MITAIVTQRQTSSCYDDQLSAIGVQLPPDTIRLELDERTVATLLSRNVSVVIASNLPIDWCYKLRGAGFVTIVFGPRSLYAELVDIVVDHAHAADTHYFTGPEFDFSKKSSESFVDIVRLVKILDWDSDFFARTIAYVSCLHLSQNIYKNISRFVSENKVDLLEYLCNCHDWRSVQTAEKEGFSFVDIRLTFVKELISRESAQMSWTNDFFKAEECHIPLLREIAAPLYVQSRYFFDPNFGEDRAREFYVSWIERAVLGLYDDECWCLRSSDEIVAFCSIRYLQSGVARLGLVGVRPGYSGFGFGREVLERSIGHLRSSGVTRVLVTTQGRNYSAQNLYQSAGFKTLETQLWYHKWR